MRRAALRQHGGNRNLGGSEYRGELPHPGHLVKQRSKPRQQEAARDTGKEGRGNWGRRLVQRLYYVIPAETGKRHIVTFIDTRKKLICETR
jgi:hypothetical protein